METQKAILSASLQLTLERLQFFLPQFFAALLIFACGLLLGWFIKVLLRRILTWMRFDDGCHRLGLSGLLGRGGIGETPSLLLGRLAGVLVVLIFSLLAIGSFDLAILQRLIERFLAYIPHVLIAGVLLLLALLLGNFAGRSVLIACVNAGSSQARLCGRVARILVVVLGIVMALEQLGIGKETVLLAFGIAFGGVVLALAIAFGLGGRDFARDYLASKLEASEKDDSFSHL